MSLLLNKLPCECLYYTLHHFSTESDRAAFASVSQECKEAIQTIRTHEEFVELNTFPKESFIGKIAHSIPPASTNLVERVKKSAVASIRKDQNLLFPNDWSQIKAYPDSKTYNLTLKQLNTAGEIQRNNLVSAFDELILAEPVLAMTLKITPNMSVEQKNFQIRNAFETMNLSQIENILFASIVHEEIVIIKFIFGTDRPFGSDFLNEMLETAIEIGNQDSIQLLQERIA